MKDNVILDKSKLFAVRIVKLYRMLSSVNNEYVLSRQVLRSGTSIGANVREAQHSQSKKDFIHKMSIALKEAYETEYWLELLNETDYIKPKLFESLYSDCNELNRLLTSIVRTSREEPDL